MNVIGNDIQTLRKMRGLTLRQVADYLDCSPQLISQYEKGKRIPKPATLDKIADALDATVGYELETHQCRLISDEDVFEKGVTLSSFSYSREQLEEQALLANYKKLNNVGQTEAQKRVEELTEIPRYTEKEE